MPDVEYTFKNILSEKFSGPPSLLRAKRNQKIQPGISPSHESPPCTSMQMFAEK